jgi:vacuolar-type H+-ATPase subunit H
MPDSTLSQILRAEKSAQTEIQKTEQVAEQAILQAEQAGAKALENVELSLNQEFEQILAQAKQTVEQHKLAEEKRLSTELQKLEKIDEAQISQASKLILKKITD